MKSLVFKSAMTLGQGFFYFTGAMSKKEECMVDKAYVMAGVIILSEVILAIGLFWAVETHLV